MPYKTLRNTFPKPADVPQSQPLPGKNQVRNYEGAYVFQADDWARLDRFLFLGSENAYYASAQELTRENAAVVERCLTESPERTIARITEISLAGRAKSNEPALFALALAASNENGKARKLAFSVLRQVARIGTHLFHFAGYCDALRGTGRGFRSAIRDWYQERYPMKLAYQLIKYRQRDGWSHRDLLRLAHPKPKDAERNALFNWVINGWTQEQVDEYRHGQSPFESLEAIWAFETMQRAKDVDEVVSLIHYALPRETIPTQFLREPKVWEALLFTPGAMPLGALVRNLGKMASVGYLTWGSDAEKEIIRRLSSQEEIKKARVHPFSFFVAMKIYAQGHGEKGNLTWIASGNITQALENAFYLAHDNVVPTNKRILVAVDTSSSMYGTTLLDMPSVDPAQGAAAMASIILRTEPYARLVAFNTRVEPNLGLVPMSTLKQISDTFAHIGGGTDCASPIRWAGANKFDFDAIVEYTDGVSWAGSQHVCVAMDEYRYHINPTTRFVEVAMEAYSYRLSEPGTLNNLLVAGLDTNVPVAVNAFISGLDQEGTQRDEVAEETD